MICGVGRFNDTEMKSMYDIVVHKQHPDMHENAHQNAEKTTGITIQHGAVKLYQ